MLLCRGALIQADACHFAMNSFEGTLGHIFRWAPSPRLPYTARHAIQAPLVLVVVLFIVARSICKVRVQSLLHKCCSLIQLRHFLVPC